MGVRLMVVDDHRLLAEALVPGQRPHGARPAPAARAVG
ncbi:DNA-binding response regulator, partial [Streptomyces nodosus]